MAAIIITIEDTADGKVCTRCSPSAEEMFQMMQSGSDLTSAHGYAMTALNAIREAAKSPESQLKIFVPRVRGQSQ